MNILKSLKERSAKQASANERQQAFTLIEVVIAVAILAVVMSYAYAILLQTLKEDKMVKKKIREGRAGDAIVSLIRRDLQGLVYLDYGREVFLGVDNGEEDVAEDQISFLTTTEVSRPKDVDDEVWADHKLSDPVYSVSYVISSNSEEVGFTLFRRTSIDLKDQPLSGGSYQAIYERVKAISFRFLDREDWVTDWDSLTRIPEELSEEDEEEAALAAIEAAAATDDADAETELEDLAVPRAIEVMLFLYVADDNGIVNDKHGEPLFEKFTFVVPLLAGESLDLAEDFLESLSEG